MLFSFLLMCVSGCDSLVKSPDLPQHPLTKDSMNDLMTTPSALPKKPLLPKPKIKQESPHYPEAFYKKVSVTFSEHVPLRAVLQSLAQTVHIDLQLDTDLNPSLFFQATDRPFIEIIEDLCEMANLRFSVKNTRIRIEKDIPYAKTYRLQFLNLTRSSQNRISVATNIFGGGDMADGAIDLGQGAGKNNQGTQAVSSGMDSSNGSDSTLSVKTNNDFWTELETNLTLLLKNDEPSDKAIDSAPPQQTPLKAEPKDDQGQEKKKKKGQKSADLTPVSPGKSSYFSLHKQGGLLTVFARDRTHQKISAYLEQLQEAASSQVLIEAKIIEVSLNSEYKSGINWSRVTGGFQTQGNFGDMANASRYADPTSVNQNLVTFSAVGSEFSSILKVLEEFGHARTLSSPRLTVMNNQAAILKVAQNQVYFKLNYDKQNYSSLSPSVTSSISSTIQTVPIGLIMAVQPSINMENGDVILFLRPTISKFNRTVQDPAVNIAYNANLSSTSGNAQLATSNIPVVEVREIDSVMKLRDGEIGILGGLMEVASYEDTNRLPGTDGFPLVQDIFSSKNKGDRIVELVILLKVTISKNGDARDPADERLRTDYLADPRKWKEE